MLRSILTLASRNLRLNFSYAAIAVSSLVVGLTCAILIFLWASFEFGFDRYHPDNERVFAVMSNELVEGEIETSSETQVPLADLLRDEIPEVEAFTRVDNSRVVLSRGNVQLSKVGAYADSGFFQLFIPLSFSGDLTTALNDIHAIAISQRLSNLLFKGEDAIGKYVMLNLKTEFRVSAVFEDFPENSSVSYIDFVLPFNSKTSGAEDWQDYHVKLLPGADKLRVEKKIDSRFREYYGNNNVKAFLFPLTDWRLHWSFENGKVSGGRINQVLIFVLTAIFILIMACVNYMNLATARASTRAKEIGVRKMTGATQRVLIFQFMIESLALAFISLAIAIGAVYLLLPMFNSLMNERLTMDLLDGKFLTGVIAMTMICGSVDC